MDRIQFKQERQFSKSELVNYFSLEEKFLKSDYSDLVSLCFLLKMLHIGELQDRGKYLLKTAYDKNNLPHNLTDFNKLQVARQLKLQGTYFYPDFENFIINGK